jgi:hypothetical protein
VAQGEGVVCEGKNEHLIEEDADGVDITYANEDLGEAWFEILICRCRGGMV